MVPDKKSLSILTRRIARDFIELHYPGEISAFDTIWDTLKIHLETTLVSNAHEAIESKSTANAAAVHFADGDLGPLVSPVVLAIVADAIRAVNFQELSKPQLESAIVDMAAQYGSKPRLAATLAKHLPDMLIAIANEEDATISTSPKVMYEIYTGGTKDTVPSIAEYEARKDGYLIWIDLDEKTHASHINPKTKITHRHIKLLMHLTRELGTRTPVDIVLKNISDNYEHIDPAQCIDRLETMLSNINAFCNKKFRQYLFGSRHKNGIGLQNTFADKYFFFRRVQAK